MRRAAGMRGGEARGAGIRGDAGSSAFANRRAASAAATLAAATRSSASATAAAAAAAVLGEGGEGGEGGEAVLEDLFSLGAGAAEGGCPLLAAVEVEAEAAVWCSAVAVSVALAAPVLARSGRCALVPGAACRRICCVAHPPTRRGV